VKLDDAGNLHLDSLLHADAVLIEASELILSGRSPKVLVTGSHDRPALLDP
jgi:hypothetical protein